MIDSINTSAPFIKTQTLQKQATFKIHATISSRQSTIYATESRTYLVNIK